MCYQRVEDERVIEWMSWSNDCMWALDNFLFNKVDIIRVFALISLTRSACSIIDRSFMMHYIHCFFVALCGISLWKVFPCVCCFSFDHSSDFRWGIIWMDFKWISWIRALPMPELLQFTPSPQSENNSYPDPLTVLSLTNFPIYWSSGPSPNRCLRTTSGRNLDPESASEHLGILSSPRYFELVHVSLEKHLGFSVRETCFICFWDNYNFIRQIT